MFIKEWILLVAPLHISVADRDSAIWNGQLKKDIQKVCFLQWLNNSSDIRAESTITLTYCSIF